VTGDAPRTELQGSSATAAAEGKAAPSRPSARGWGPWGEAGWQEDYAKSTAGSSVQGSPTSLWGILYAFTIKGSLHNKQQKITESGVERDMP